MPVLDPRFKDEYVKEHWGDEYYEHGMESLKKAVSATSYLTILSLNFCLVQELHLGKDLGKPMGIFTSTHTQPMITHTHDP